MSLVFTQSFMRASSATNALTDVAMPPEIAAYRQALRDLPQSDALAPRLEWDELKGVVVLGVGWPEVG